MSHNLHLPGATLYQTPTTVTERALAAPDPMVVYFDWLDSRVAETKPKIHPRATNAQRKAIESTPAYKNWRAYAKQIDEHKADVQAVVTACVDAGQNPKWVSH